MTAKEFAELPPPEIWIDLNGNRVSIIFHDLERVHQIAHEMMKRPHVQSILVWRWRDNQKEILGVYRKTT